MRSGKAEVQWYSVRAHGGGSDGVENAADAFDDMFPYDCDKIDLIRQRYSLRREIAYLSPPQQVTLDESIKVEFRTFGEIDPAFIQYTDSFHDFEYVKHDNIWMFPAALVEEEEHQEQKYYEEGGSRKHLLSPPSASRPLVDEDILFGRGKRARRPSLIAIGE